MRSQFYGNEDIPPVIVDLREKYKKSHPIKIFLPPMPRANGNKLGVGIEDAQPYKNIDTIYVNYKLRVRGNLHGSFHTKYDELQRGAIANAADLIIQLDN
jgi:hypothetical protein